MAFVWDESNVARLRELRALGHGPKAIADAIGAPTRNSVIGKMFRLGLATQRKDRVTIEQSRGGRQTARKTEAKAPVKAPPSVPPPRSDLPPVVARITFAELDRDTCRFPVGDPGQPGFGFCGQTPVPGKAYCLTCCQRAFAFKEAS